MAKKKGPTEISTRCPRVEQVHRHNTLAVRKNTPSECVTLSDIKIFTLDMDMAHTSAQHTTHNTHIYTTCSVIIITNILQVIKDEHSPRQPVHKSLLDKKRQIDCNCLQFYFCASSYFAFFHFLKSYICFN